MTQRPALAALTLLTLLAFGLRVSSLDAQSMWRDEIDTLCFALDFWALLERAAVGDQETSPDTASTSSPGQPNCQPSPGLTRIDPSVGLWPTLRAVLTLSGWNGPLYTVAMRPWIGLTGYSPFAVRFSSLIFGLLAVPLTYVVGRRLLGTTAGLVGALLAALSPHLVWYSQEAKMYSAILTLGLLAIYGLRRAVDAPSEKLASLKWWGGMVGATSLALYTHVLAALFIPLQVVLSLIWWPRTRRRWRGALVALSLLTLPYLPLLAWQARTWLRPAGQATLFNVWRLDVMLEATFNGWGGNFVGEPWSTAILGGLGLLALSGVAWTWSSVDEPKKDRELENKENDWQEPTVLLVWALLPMLGIWLISARQAIFTNRYLIWAAPAYYLLAAAGFVTLVRARRSGALIASGLLLVVLVGDGRALLHQATQPIKPDFRGAAAFLQERYRPGDLIIHHLSYLANNFDFYFHGPYESWGAPAPAGVMSDADIDSQMRTNTIDHLNVWLVLSEPEMWDPHGQVKAWLDSHAVAPPEERAFAHVSVFHYELHK